jgi:hypothetical protein
MTLEDLSLNKVSLAKYMKFNINQTQLGNGRPMVALSLTATPLLLFTQSS